MRDDYIKNVKDTLKRLSDYLSEKTWITGSEVCA